MTILIEDKPEDFDPAKVERLFEIARPCFHYAGKGTPDGALFDRSETGRLLRKAMERIAASSPSKVGKGDGLHGRFHVMLLELLAVIHRDGGHKTQEIGLDLAFEQAMKLSSERIVTPRPETEELREALEPLLRFHETGGHEGDGSDERLKTIRQLIEARHG